jgi:TetR/AcrR family transcriptional regulator, transcriptional repressor of bet genes
MPRPSNTRERRAQIVRAFLEEVARRGYAGATVPQVAARAGLAPGLIHYHFASKQELLLELLRHLRGLVDERVRRRVRPGDGAPARLDAFLDALLSLERDADRGAVACWQVLGAEALHDRALGREYRRALRAFLRALEVILAGWPGLRRAQIRPAAAAILAAVQGCFALAACDPRAIPPGTAAASLRRMARGLLPPAALSARRRGAATRPGRAATPSR